MLPCCYSFKPNHTARVSHKSARFSHKSVRFSHKSAFHLGITVVALCWFPSSSSIAVCSQDTQTWTQYSRCVSAKRTKLHHLSLVMWRLHTHSPKSHYLSWHIANISHLLSTLSWSLWNYCLLDFSPLAAYFYSLFFFPSKALGLYLSALILILCDPFSYFNLWNLEEHFTLFPWVFPGLLDLISTVNIISMLFTFFLAYEWTCLGKKKRQSDSRFPGPFPAPLLLGQPQKEQLTFSSSGHGRFSHSAPFWWTAGSLHSSANLELEQLQKIAITECSLSLWRWRLREGKRRNGPSLESDDKKKKKTSALLWEWAYSGGLWKAKRLLGLRRQKCRPTFSASIQFILWSSNQIHDCWISWLLSVFVLNRLQEFLTMMLWYLNNYS